MESWIFQGGYPLVTVEAAGPTSVTLRQTRFAFNDVEPAQWHIPVIIKAGTGDGVTDHRVLLSDASVELELGHDVEWINANADGSGFYRVRYVGDLADAALSHIDRLDAIERYGLVDDAWAAFVADQSSLTDVIDVLAALAASEDDVSVWQRIAGVAGAIHRHLDEPAKAPFAERAIGWATAALERLPATDDDRRNQVRARLFGLAGALGHEESIVAARTMVAEGADPEHLAAAIGVVASHGSAADFAGYVQAMKAAATPQEERRYMFALAAFPGDDELTQLLALIDAGDVRSQDAPFVLGRAVANHHQGITAWTHVRDNWDDLSERFPHNSIVRMVSGVESLADEAVAAEVVAFFADHPLPQAGKTLDQHLERMQVNVGVRRRIRAEASSAI